MKTILVVNLKALMIIHLVAVVLIQIVVVTIVVLLALATLLMIVIHHGAVVLPLGIVEVALMIVVLLVGIGNTINKTLEA
jgi:hypothetical protein